MTPFEHSCTRVLDELVGAVSGEAADVLTHSDWITKCAAHFMDTMGSDQARKALYCGALALAIKRLVEAECRAKSGLN